MISWLVQTFIKDYTLVEDKTVRNQYGYLAGMVGIILNLLLFMIKFLVGALTGSIAVMADAFNNFSDMASSVVTIVGFKLASIPADKDHPFGHGRSEYISAMIVAFMVMFVGGQFVLSSIERILSPTNVSFEWLSFLLLLGSIGVKLWLGFFNRELGARINSKALKASATDAFGDVLTSSVVLVSFLLIRWTDLPIDGYVGVVVAIAILFAGYNLVKETISPLLGEAPDEALVSEIITLVLNYEHIIGVHDLIVHNYGVHHVMASLHAEIPSDLDIMTIHEVIDQAEREISAQLGIYLVIHMDPILLDCEEVNASRAELDVIVTAHPAILSYHDFRVIGKDEQKNLIFDLVINASLLNKDITEESIKQDVIKALLLTHPTYQFVITIDKAFV